MGCAEVMGLALGSNSHTDYRLLATFVILTSVKLITITNPCELFAAFTDAVLDAVLQTGSTWMSRMKSQSVHFDLSTTYTEIEMRQSTQSRGLASLTAFCIMAAFVTSAMAQPGEPKIKVLAPAADPLKNAVLIGRVTTGNMIFQLEIEASEPMWMQMGNPPAWGKHTPAANERFHVELKLTDPKSKTRIPYAGASFAATNQDTGKSMTLPLPPMWGSSGLHYSANSALLGDGAYAATVTVDVPTFERELKDKDLWAKPVSAKFHFKLSNGKLTEVSQADR